jgi:apolipoprotein N-acyltransferase
VHGSGGVDVFVCGLNEVFDPSGTMAEMSALQTRLRAIEFRRPYCHVSRGGFSGEVDSCGRVLARTSQPAGEATILVASPPRDQRTTVYSRWGDWLPTASSAVVALAVLLHRRWPWPAVAGLRSLTSGHS